MSNIFNDYASREALLRDVESAIAETTDGQGIRRSVLPAERPTSCARSGTN
ncbi:MAG: hypothetical protein II486_04330 [Thermoguttaceae bacterium]|nr:hypothetical protein [Thermoguttaceae bacterium]